MKLKNNITKFGIIALASLTLTVGVAAAAASAVKPIETNAIYDASTHYDVSDTASELASYYSGTSGLSGDSLLTELRSINSSKKRKTISYSTFGTNTNKSPYVYTDYALDGVMKTDSYGGKYSETIASFYTKTSVTSGSNTTVQTFNKEHVWPKSHGGNLVEDDALMPRPTISSENSSRGNSFFVTNMNNTSSGWDPYTAGYDKASRGECARIIFYCMVANSNLKLVGSNTSSSDNTMGNIHDLMEWHYQYSPNVYEINRNNGAEYIQGNRNPFVDHPEWVADIWGSFDTTVANTVAANESMYDNWVPGSASTYGSNDAVNSKLTISASSKSLAVGDSTTISATSSNSSTITWTTSDSSVVSVSNGSAASGASITLTANATGTATITAKATIDGSQVTQTCTVTVTTSGGSSQTGTDGNINLENGVGGTDQITWTEDWGTMVQAKGTSSNFVNTYISAPRVYQNNTLTFTTNTNYTISKIVFNCSGTGYVDGFGSSTSTGSVSVSGSTATWTGSDVTSVVFTPTAQVRPTSITVTYNYNGGSSSTKTLSSLSKSGTLSKSTYYVGDTFDATGLTFTANFSDSTSSNVTSSVTFSPSPLTAGTTSVTASYTYGGTTKTVTVSGLTVVTKTLQSLSKSGTPSKTSYNAGESFNASGLTVTATFNGGTEDVTNSVVWTPSPLTAGTTSVTGTYTYNGVSKTVTVSGITVSEAQETYHVTLTTSNDNLSTSALTSDSTLSYSILNSSDVASGSNMNITWSTGCKNTIATNYSEVTIPNGSTVTPSDDTEVKSILIDWYHGSDNATVKADGVTITGTSTTLSGSSGVPTLYTFSSATSNWSIAGSNSSYNANAYSITFEITGLPQTVAATGVTLTPQASSIAVGGTATLTANVLPSNASNKTVTWSSNKTSVATVSNGIVTGVAAGSATITVTTEDGGYTATCAISVSASSSTSYDLVSSGSLTAGDVIVFACNTEAKTAGSISSQVMTSISSTFSSDKSQITSLGSGTLEFTVGKSGSNYTFTNNNSLLGATAVKKLALGSGTTTWTVSISSGTATVSSTNSSYGSLYYNAGSPRFTTYSSKQTEIQIYKKTATASSSSYTSDSFAADFLNALTCDVNGNNAPTLSLTWAELKTKYNSIDSSAERETLTNATYKIEGFGSNTTVTATGTTTDVVALAMSRYDILISKYSSTYSDNFIGRPASAQQNLFITQSESSTTMMIVIVSIISISAISGFIFLKKRKEN